MFTVVAGTEPVDDIVTGLFAVHGSGLEGVSGRWEEEKGRRMEEKTITATSRNTIPFLIPQFHPFLKSTL